jgi:hypothetical protein
MGDGTGGRQRVAVTFSCYIGALFDVGSVL